MVTTTREFKVIGTRPLRPDGVDKVTGRAQYGADIRLTGMLFGRVKRSPYAHALIKSIDVSKAVALPGVRAVVTAADFPTSIVGARDAGFPTLTRIMAGDKVLFRGHAVAAVCATDPHIAADAVDLIEVEYEPLPAVFDVREAMLDIAPILHANMKTQGDARSFSTSELEDLSTDKASNIASHGVYAIGDIDQGFAASDVVIEREYETPRYHQGYIEPHNATAFWNKDGKVTVWTSTQGMFAQRTSLADLLQVSVSRITVVGMEIGGGFGGKIDLYLEPLAALLSRKAGRPVKITMSREEVFVATGPTSASYMRVKLGAKHDGTIVAAQASLAFEAGAFPGSPVFAGARGIFAPYAVANQRVDFYDVVVNLSKTASYRAPGTPAAMFAGESTMNELAELLGMDPMDLRLKNASKQGDKTSNGQVFSRPIGNEAVMEAMREHPHYRSELQGPMRGRGVGMGFWGNGGRETSSSASVNADGRVHLVLGSVDIGGSRASLSMQLAETLGIQYDDISARVVDTDSVGWTDNTGGSRTTFAGGWAAHDLGVQIQAQMCARAARIWECAVEEVRYEDGVIIRPADEGGKGRSLSFKEMAARLPGTGGTIEVGVNVNYSTSGPSFAGHIVDVEVDRDTGKVTILRYTAFQDVGKAIHPSYVEGQMQGGVAQGIGMALTEEYCLGNEGQQLNASFLDYRMPTSLDLPMIDTVLVEVPNPGHPFGVRGVGEVPIVPPLAAVQAAVYNATGIRFRKLPISPRAVLEQTLKE